VQVSILIKLLIARFMNSAVLTFLVTRKSEFLSAVSIQSDAGAM